MVIHSRFFEDMTLEEIGERLGISHEGVRLIELKARRKLKFFLINE